MNFFVDETSDIDNDIHKLIDAISIYFIRIYFYGETSQYVLNLLKLAFDETIIDSIKRAKVTKFNTFGDIAKILSGVELLQISPETFDLYMRKFFGKYAYETYIQKALTNFIAVMAALAAPTDIFKEAYPIDENLHKRIEELLLNEQKHVIIHGKNNH